MELPGKGPTAEAILDFKPRLTNRCSQKVKTGAIPPSQGLEHCAAAEECRMGRDFGRRSRPWLREREGPAAQRREGKHRRCAPVRSPCPQAESAAGIRSLPEGRLGRGNASLPAGRVGRGNTAPARRQPSPIESPQADPAAEQKQLAAAQPLGEGCDEIAENGHAKGRDEKVGTLEHNGIGLDDKIAGHGNQAESLLE